MARLAARWTERYRTTLRRYDPLLPVADIVVCENPPDCPLFERYQTDPVTAE